MKWSNNECIDCQWCCEHENTPIPGGIEYAYLYYTKGRSIYWEPFTKEWYWLANKKCQHAFWSGCQIYENRPRLCRVWYCPFGPNRIKQRFNILLEAGQRIMKEYERRGTFK